MAPDPALRTQLLESSRSFLAPDQALRTQLLESSGSFSAPDPAHRTYAMESSGSSMAPDPVLHATAAMRNISRISNRLLNRKKFQIHGDLRIPAVSTECRVC